MIGFALPGALALLLALGIIWFLHTRTKRRAAVPSLMLWQKVKAPAHAPARRRLVPRFTLPLLLQLLAVIAFALALANPFFGQGSTPEHVVVVFDTGAKMHAVKDGRPLFDEAKSRVLAQMGSGRQPPAYLSVIEAGGVPRYIAARWDWSDAATGAAIDKLVPTDLPTDWSAAARLLPGLLKSGEVSSTILVSAGDVPEALGAVEGLSHIRLVAPGSDRGLTGKLTPIETEAGVYLLAGAVNFRSDDQDPAVIDIDYQAAVGEPVQRIASLTVSPAENGSVAFQRRLELPQGGLVFARIADDVTPRDNRLRFVVNPAPVEVAVLYVGPGEQPLLRALDSAEGVRLFRADTADDAARYSLAILDRVPASRLPATNVVVISPQTTPIGTPDPDGWTDDHPLARDVDWTALNISKANVVPKGANGEVLLSVGGAALITAETTPSGRVVRLGFDPTDSNWPEQSSFPIFAANLLDWIGPFPGKALPSSCTVGMPCQLDARLVGNRLENLETGFGTEQIVNDDGFVPLETGLYIAGSGDRTRLIAVNPAPDEVTQATAAAEAPLEWPRLLARLLFAIALLVVLVDLAIAERSARRLRWSLFTGVLAAAATLAAVMELPALWTRPVNSVAVVQPAGSAPAEGDRGATIIIAGIDPQIAEPDASARSTASRLTNVPLALELAAAHVQQPERTPRIVLAGDFGAERVGSGMGQGARVDMLSIAATPPNFRVARIDVASSVPAETASRMTVLIDAPEARSVPLKIAIDGDVVAEQTVDLMSGSNRIEANLPKLRQGERVVEARIEGQDAAPQDDTATAMVLAQELRPIAVISPTPTLARNFTNTLRDNGVAGIVLSPQRAPVTVEQWQEYGGIALIDTPALSMTTRQQRLIETVVRENGLGLMLVGGPNTFGPGGYYNTPFETLSPVSARVPEVAPEVAMLFVLDRSGSMEQKVGSGTRLDMAKSATAAAVKLLNPQSRVGIVVFDEVAQTILPLTKLDTAPDAVERSLRPLVPGGGTAIHAGLAEAVEQMRGVTASAKHIVVMTDGLSRPGDIPGAIAQLRSLGTTVSAVAVGRGADGATAREIARLGGGVAHASEDFEALPSILAQEAMQFTSPVQDGDTTPVWETGSAPFVDALPVRLPTISGLVATTAKPTATLAITAPGKNGKPLPLLAHWQYGNGQVLALTTDANGPWSPRWQNLPEVGAFWADVARHFQPRTPNDGLDVHLSSDGEFLQVEARMFVSGKAAQPAGLSAVLIAPDEAELAIPLREVAEGTFRGKIGLHGLGQYHVEVAGVGAEPVTVAYFHGRDPQIDPARSGGAQALVRATGGGVITHEQIESLGRETKLGWVNAGPIWGALGLLLFLAQLFLRYIGQNSIWPGRARHSLGDTK